MSIRSYRVKAFSAHRVGTNVGRPPSNLLVAKDANGTSEPHFKMASNAWELESYKIGKIMLELKQCLPNNVHRLKLGWARRKPRAGTASLDKWERPGTSVRQMRGQLLTIHDGQNLELSSARRDGTPRCKRNGCSMRRIE
uniref:Uncharacterized protein n=1 Tax=Trichuris muris TaxID=70415 RepID=A0A5S6QH68_TRIMR